ncbi:phosphatase PAP2 family protein [Paenibacillus sp. UNC451MF]|uniref:phosphatase PAP2 family protein n=1 Tax=Paenibacillus sp. UNC451MF TaxID=1449063 RepID=UPI00048F945E|nr:phosphatase PAP2 family protein [Paenibacillus sp. UNC451MF]
MKQLQWLLARAFLICLLCAMGFGLVALLISDQSITAFDQTLISFIQGKESPVLTAIMKAFSFIGAGIPATVLTVLTSIFLYKVLGHRREVIFFLTILMSSWLLNELLKIMFHRARPTIHRIAEATGYSFPSGHSMAAFTLYGALSFLIWRHIPTAWGKGLFLAVSAVMIGMIGMSRIYLGVHYPSDVIGGYFASGSLLALFIWLFRRIQDRYGRQAR